jgi:hypothetical protein
MDTTSPLTATPTIQEQITDAAPQHDNLVQTIRETEYAALAVRQSKSSTSVLANKLKELQTRASALQIQRDNDKGVLQEYYDSRFRRLAHTIRLKKSDFEHNIKWLESRYKSTIKELEDVRAELTKADTELAEAQQTQVVIEAAEADHKSALKALDTLYEAIFGGPTPGMPEEDQEELAVAEADHKLGELETKLRNEKQALEILDQAAPVLSRLVTHLAKAISASASGLENPGGDFMNDEERVALKAAKAIADELDKLIQQAQAASTAVKGITIVKVPEGHYRGLPWRTNERREIEFYNTLFETRRQAIIRVDGLRQEQRRSRERIEALEQNVKDVQKDLQKGRVRLQEIRRNAFGEVMEGLPDYDTSH